MSECRVEVDWVHLPAGVEPRSLWSCLHDTELKAAASDIWGRSVVLEFDLLHLLEHHRLPDDLRFRFCLSEITAVRAVTFAYPEPPPLSGMTVDEQLRLKGEYTSRGRDESVSWSSFEASLTDTRFEVLDAEIAEAEETVALHLEGRLDDEYWYKLFVQAGSLSVERSDQVVCGLEEFIQLGGAYWDAFNRRQRENA